MTPTGRIKTQVPGGIGNTTWESITRWDEHIEREAIAVQWPVSRVRGHVVIESRGDPNAMQPNTRNGYSYGLMQVVPYGVVWDGWHTLVKEKAGLPKNASKQRVIDALYDPAINIAVGVAILEDFYQRHKTLDKASSAFFLGNPNWTGGDSVNGTSGADYKRALDGLIKEQKAFEPVDPIAVIMGGPNYHNFFGFDVKTDLPYYSYGVGHGLDGHSHTGYDITTTLNQRLYTPGAGVVTCAGTGRGQGSWKTGCAAFPDYFGGGAGRVEVMLDCGVSVILGHASQALVAAGTRVQAGQPIATAGGMNSLHVHLETRVWDERLRDYRITDPYTTLVAALSDEPLPPSYAERIPVAQAADFLPDQPRRVVVLADEVPVLQGAYADSPHVGPPLTKGEDFRAVYLMPGRDGAFYWISEYGARVPFRGTTSDEWPSATQPPDEPGPDVDTIVGELEAVRTALTTAGNDADRALREAIRRINDGA